MCILSNAWTPYRPELGQCMLHIVVCYQPSVSSQPATVLLGISPHYKGNMRFRSTGLPFQLSLAFPFLQLCQELYLSYLLSKKPVQELYKLNHLESCQISPFSQRPCAPYHTCWLHHKPISCSSWPYSTVPHLL